MIRKLARHPVHPSRSNVRVSLNVEKKKIGKRRSKGKEKFPSRYSIDKEVLFPPPFRSRAHTFSGHVDIRGYFASKNEAVCAI